MPFGIDNASHRPESCWPSPVEAPLSRDPPSLDCQPFLVTLSGFASLGGHLRSQDC